jgi:hypothetical protein
LAAAINREDDDGGGWYLATWWADYSPTDPEVFRGSGGSCFVAEAMRRSGRDANVG